MEDSRVGTTVYASVAGLCLGVAFTYLYAWSTTAMLSLFLHSLLLLGAARFKKEAAVVALVCASMLVGVWRANVALHAEAQNNLALFAGQTVVAEGVVSDDPDVRDTSVRTTTTLTKINGEPAHGTVLAILPPFTPVAYGDQVHLRGIIAPPETFLTDTGHTFDYPNYLRARGISMMLERATLTQSTPGGFSIERSLFSLKHAFDAAIEKTFSEPQGALLEGLLLGERRGLDRKSTRLNSSHLKLSRMPSSA